MPDSPGPAVLSPMYTQVGLPAPEREEARRAAHRITMSPHEWDWTEQEQQQMARYVLWASQRLDAIEQLSGGHEFEHMEE